MKTFRTLHALALAVAATTICGHAAASPSTFRVDDTAPVQATLLPEVSVTASRAHPDAEPQLAVAATAPLQVTLLPTVHVRASAFAPMPARALRAVAQLPAFDESLADNGSSDALPAAVRTQLSPR